MHCIIVPFQLSKLVPASRLVALGSSVSFGTSHVNQDDLRELRRAEHCVLACHEAEAWIRWGSLDSVALHALHMPHALQLLVAVGRRGQRR